MGSSASSGLVMDWFHQRSGESWIERFPRWFGPVWANSILRFSFICVVEVKFWLSGFQIDVN